MLERSCLLLPTVVVTKSDGAEILKMLSTTSEVNALFATSPIGQIHEQQAIGFYVVHPLQGDTGYTVIYY